VNEVVFIKQNKDRWKTYETPTNDPDELAQRFVYLIDDLGYVKTHYPLSSTKEYLNNIASSIYISIYKTKKEDKGRIARFFKTEVPEILFNHRNVIYFSLFLFLAFYLIGLFSSAHDETFTRAILSDEYVNTTQNNIAAGKPFAIYDGMNQVVMFFYIAWNNIRVSLLCLFSGLTAGLGTVYVMLTNGIMVGSFHQMFIAEGYGTKWLFVVMIHGTLELFAIIISGACGFMIANAFLFPKTYTRLVALRMAAKDAVKIMITVALVLIVAAFLESFVTRYEDMPIIFSILILLGSLGFIVYYYFIKPRKVHQQKVSFEQMQTLQQELR